MNRRKKPYGVLTATLILGLALILGAGVPIPAQAGTEDAAMFYDELAQHGEWVDYDKYGPVWYPSQVEQDWRPYINGRWVPTEQGQVFETQEPWGWATYHYGNWMPTDAYGWVWVPGRTWYPSTVTWRTSPETTPVDESYIGWAPVPPPDYVPPASYAPASYYAGSPVTNLITAPFWIFIEASKFLLGFGQSYTPAYSYMDCGCLAPPAYVPVIMPAAPMVVNYYTPAYYPRAFFGRGVGIGYGAYGWGPPVRYISRVTHINQTIINRNININTRNIVRIRNVRAPQNVISRHAGIRHIQPPGLTRGHRLPPPRRVRNVARAQASLGKPNIVPRPRNVPRLTAHIPKASRVGPPRKGIVGAGLPSKSVRHLTPAQRSQIRKLPPNKHITPAAAPMRGRRPPPQAGKPGVTPSQRGRPGVTPPHAGKPGVTPSRTGRPGVTPPHAGKPGVTPPTAGKPGVTPSRAGRPGVTPSQRGKPGVTPPRATTTPTKPGWSKPTTTRAGTPPSTTSRTRTGAPLPRSQKGVSPAERQKMEREQQRRQRGGQPSTTGPSGTKSGFTRTPPSSRTTKQPSGFQPRTGQRPAATTHRGTTPTQRRTTPTYRGTRPTQRATTPTSRPGTPTQRATTPQRRPTTPSQRAITPQRRPTTPSQRAITPQRRPTTPTHKATVPQRRPAASTHRATVPQRRPAAPTRRATTPQQRPTQRAAPQRRPAAPRAKAPPRKAAPAPGQPQKKKRPGESY